MLFSPFSFRFSRSASASQNLLSFNYNPPLLLHNLQVLACTKRLAITEPALITLRYRGSPVQLHGLKRDNKGLASAVPPQPELRLVTRRQNQTQKVLDSLQSLDPCFRTSPIFSPLSQLVRAVISSYIGVPLPVFTTLGRKKSCLAPEVPSTQLQFTVPYHCSSRLLQRHLAPPPSQDSFLLPRVPSFTTLSTSIAAANFASFSFCLRSHWKNCQHRLLTPTTCLLSVADTTQQAFTPPSRPEKKKKTDRIFSITIPENQRPRNLQ